MAGTVQFQHQKLHSGQHPKQQKQQTDQKLDQQSDQQPEQCINPLLNVTNEKILQISEPQWLKNIRLSAIKKFYECKFPLLVYGLDINIDIKDAPIDTVRYSEQPLPKGALPLPEAAEKYPEIKEMIKAHMEGPAAEEKFDALHNACFSGYCIVIPEGKHLGHPIEIRTDINESCASTIILIAEKNSRASIVEHITSSGGKPLFHSQAMKVIAKDGAQVNISSVQTHSGDVWHFVRKSAKIGRDAQVNWLDGIFGGKLSRLDVRSTLDGQGAHANTWSISFGAGKQATDIYADTIHASPDTTSDILARGVLTDSAKLIYRGLIKINKNASRSSGYQKSDTLILSGDAEADAIPNLEIDTNDVKCSHGATVGQVDPEQLFYLMSRGLAEDEAVKTLVMGFINPILDKLAIESVKAKVRTLAEERL